MNPAQYFFPVYKGLQKPLEFMGLRGRFMTMAAVGIGFAFLGYCLGAFIFGQLIGCILCLVIAGGSYLYLFLKQKQGLHSKQKNKEILIYQNIFIR